MPTVNFVNEGKVIEVQAGENLRTVALANDIAIYSNERAGRNCNGQGKCGTCQVEISDMGSVSAKTEKEEAKFQILKPHDDVRLACQCQVEGDVEVKTLQVEM